MYENAINKKYMVGAAELETTFHISMLREPALDVIVPVLTK